jgi:hypothetical protein
LATVAWFLIRHALFFAATYYGTIRGVDTCLNLSKFYVWFTFFICTISTLFEMSALVNKPEELAKKRSTHGFLGNIIWTATYIVCMGMLVAYGNFATGVACSLIILQIYFCYLLEDQAYATVKERNANFDGS